MSGINYMLFVHAAILVYTSQLVKHQVASDDPHSVQTRKIDFKDRHSWSLNIAALTNESIVRHFSWAQWDPVVQALYYIHMKPSARNSLVESGKDDSSQGLMPTLSAHQFHDDLPTETVVSDYI